MEEPEILKDEVRSALAKMNRNKAARPDGIVTNAFSLDDFAINRIPEVINEL